ncbi:hypothetical protein [Streptomyces sp. NPDC017993]|uniref:hypothetical protein n=1 Tax=Streptomyces sp. NPDC017993 TaxID=3365027 RepID=UPI003790F65F
MADAPRAQPVVVDGQELVAVSGEDFARLLAIRRQVGGQSARIRALTTTLGDLLGTLDVIDGRLTEVNAVHACASGDCAVCAALARLSEEVREARRAAAARGRVPEDRSLRDLRGRTS